jgi:hypothetical protein
MIILRSDDEEKEYRMKQKVDYYWNKKSMAEQFKFYQEKIFYMNYEDFIVENLDELYDYFFPINPILTIDLTEKKELELVRKAWYELKLLEKISLYLEYQGYETEEALIDDYYQEIYEYLDLKNNFDYWFYDNKHDYVHVDTFNQDFEEAIQLDKGKQILQDYLIDNKIYSYNDLKLRHKRIIIHKIFPIIF